MSKTQIVLLVAIILFSLFLRFHNYATYPQRGATSDEYSYSFLGVSLLTKGQPISWSAFSPYAHRYDLTINNIYFPMVYPYFDHPPLFATLVGAWSIATGGNTFETIDLKTIRIVPIVLSTISLILLFLIGFRLYGYKIAMWALLIYSTATIFVINSRVVMSENMLTTVFLAALYLFIVAKNRMGQKTALVIGVLSGAAVVTKTMGIALMPAMAYLFLQEGIKRRTLMHLILGFIIVIAGYLFYAAYFDWNLFWQVQAVQAGRHVGPQAALLLTSAPVIVNKVFYDGWYFFGIFTIFFSLLNFQKHKLILPIAMVYFLFLLSSITREGHSGWYMIPLFPFMALTSASYLSDMLKTKSWGIVVFLLCLGLSSILHFYEEPFGLTPFRFRTLLALLFVPALISLLLKKDTFYKFLGNFWFYLFIFGNAILTFVYVHPA